MKMNNMGLLLVSTVLAVTLTQYVNISELPQSNTVYASVEELDCAKWGDYTIHNISNDDMDTLCRIVKVNVKCEDYDKAYAEAQRVLDLLTTEEYPTVDSLLKVYKIHNFEDVMYGDAVAEAVNDALIGPAIYN